MTSLFAKNLAPYGVAEDEYSREIDQFSIVAAAQGIASGRGLRGREAEINQELERRSLLREAGSPTNISKTRRLILGSDITFERHFQARLLN